MSNQICTKKRQISLNSYILADIKPSGLTIKGKTKMAHLLLTHTLPHHTALWRKEVMSIMLQANRMTPLLSVH